MSNANPNWPAYSFPQALARLPAQCRRKYAQLQRTVDDGAALERLGHERRMQAEETLGRARYRLSYLAEEDTVDRAELTDEICAIEADLELQGHEASRRRSALTNHQQTMAQLLSFIPTAVDGGAPLAAVTARAQPNPGESLTDAVLRVRGQITETYNEMVRLKNAPLPPDEVKARLIAVIDAASARGRPRIDLAGGKVSLTFADQPLFGSGALAAPAGSASDMLCWMFRGEMVKALTTGLESNTSDGIAAHERPAREAELQAKLLHLERTEESLVEQALAANLDVHRRISASPFAIIGLGFAHQLAGMSQAAE